MCTCSTAKRRRAQARKNYAHLPPRDRPRFQRPAAGAAELRAEHKRLARAGAGRRGAAG